MTDKDGMNSNWHSRLLRARGWLFLGAGVIALVVWLVRR